MKKYIKPNTKKVELEMESLLEITSLNFGTTPVDGSYALGKRNGRTGDAWDFDDDEEDF